MNEAGASIPSHCRVLVVGGGAVGTSVAYHLAAPYDPKGEKILR